MVISSLFTFSSTIFGQDTKEKIKSIIDSYPLDSYQKSTEQFFIYSNLPGEYLKKAINKYAKGKVTEEDVLLFHYNGVGGLTGNSFIVTEDKLYYLNNVNAYPHEKSGVIDLKSIGGFKYFNKIDTDKGPTTYNLMIYGNDGDPIAKLMILTYKKKKASILIDLLDSIVYEVTGKPLSEGTYNVEKPDGLYLSNITHKDLQLLLEHGLDPNKVREGKSYGEHITELGGRTSEEFSLLIKHGWKPTFSDGSTLLHKFMYTDKNVVPDLKTLLDQGLDPNIVNNMNETPLVTGILFGYENRRINEENINFLLDQGSDVNISFKERSYVITPSFEELSNTGNRVFSNMAHKYNYTNQISGNTLSLLLSLPTGGSKESKAKQWRLINRIVDKTDDFNLQKCSDDCDEIFVTRDIRFYSLVDVTIYQNFMFSLSPPHNRESSNSDQLFDLLKKMINKGGNVNVSEGLDLKTFAREKKLSKLLLFVTKNENKE